MLIIGGEALWRDASFKLIKFLNTEFALACIKYYHFDVADDIVGFQKPVRLFTSVFAYSFRFVFDIF